MSRLMRISLYFALTTLSFATPVDRALSSDTSVVLSGMNLEWPGANAKSIYKTSGHYDPRNIIATRSQIYKDEAIVVFPRYRPGVPFTLGIAKLPRKGHYVKPTIAPFPSWSLQEEGNCDALQNSVDVVLDEQDVVWILDIGAINTLEHPVRHCPPKIVAISMKSREVIDVFELRKWVNSASRLQYLVVHHTEDGGIFLFISDAGTRAIIGYDVDGLRGFRFVLPEGVTQARDRPDVLYLNLVRKNCGTSFLFITYLGASRMFTINAEQLCSNFTKPSIIDVGPKDKKIVMLGNDDDGGIFFRNKKQSDIYMWNVNTRFTSDNFVLVQKGNDYRVPTRVFPGHKRHLWVMESNIQDYVKNTVGCGGASVILHPLVKSAEYL